MYKTLFGNNLIWEFGTIFIPFLNHSTFGVGWPVKVQLKVTELPISTDWYGGMIWEKRGAKNKSKNKKRFILSTKVTWTHL